MGEETEQLLVWNGQNSQRNKLPFYLSYLSQGASVTPAASTILATI
jgi:hypothetical protein